MDKFGVILSKMLLTLTEAYDNGDKKLVKEILTKIKNDKKFREYYQFYENFENKTITDQSLAKEYVDTISEMLKGKTNEISEISKNIYKLIKNASPEKNNLYENIDVLLENDSILNAENKIKAKKYLVEFLINEKNSSETDEPGLFVENEKLLYTILSSNFQSEFNNILSEEEKNEFKSLMSLDDNLVEQEVNTLKLEVCDKIDNLLTENKTSEVIAKLKETLERAKQMPPTKYNLHKLRELKKAL